MVGDRIRELRKNLNLTQSRFGEIIGLKQNSVAVIESGRNIPSDQTIFAICREFRVNETWLRTGEGEMFVPSPEDEIEQLCERYGLNRAARVLIEKFVTLPGQDRQAVLNYFLSVAAEMRGEKTLDEMTDAEIADAVRRGEQMEKRADARSEA